WHQVLGHPRGFVMDHGYWGPQFDDGAIDTAIAARAADLQAAACDVRRLERRDEFNAWTAARIAEGLVVGWFQGRMEWGARALGNRSIPADPRPADMREIINTRIKFRERLRPFAPSVLEEARDDFFEGAASDPFMLQVYPVRADRRADIPAVTHVDGSGRMQTVSRATNPEYWSLIR